MAISSSTIHDVRTGGSDTLNGGMFDPSKSAGMFTDGAATSGTGNSPVFSSASYTFVAGDVGAWVYIADGTDWNHGWYQIASVSAGAATLNASVGTAVNQDTLIPNTVAGCATVASPTGATWSVDYGKQNAAQYTYTDLASVGAGLTVSSALQPFSKEQVGNSIVITGGTNFNTGRYVIASVAAGVATVVGPTNITSGVGANGTGGQGGSWASPGAACQVHVAGNAIYVNAATYSITSASTNIPSGCIALTAGTSGTQTKLIGYQSVWGDGGTKPLLQASGISSFTILSVPASSIANNISVDGATLTSGRGVNVTNAGLAYRCKALNCTNSGMLGTTTGWLVLCEATGCLTSAAAIAGSGICIGCYSHDNSNTGFSASCFFCVSANNSGTSDGFLTNNFGCVSCTSYGNGRDGFRLQAGTSCGNVFNCLSVNNSGWGYNGTATYGAAYIVNSGGYNNTSGLINTNLPTQNQLGILSLSGDPFTNAAGGDFSLNSTSGAGALARAAGIPSASGLTALPGLSTPSYPDVGASQHQDTPATTVTLINFMQNIFLNDN